MSGRRSSRLVTSALCICDRAESRRCQTTTSLPIPSGAARLATQDCFPRSSCRATLTKYRFLSTASFFFFLSRCFVLVSALRFALLVQILMWQTAMPIDVALMPNQALTSGTCSLFIKAHIHHFAVVSFPPTLKHLLIWLVCMHDDPNRFHRIN